MPVPPSATTPSVRPFLKWAGGKTGLLPELLPRLPASFGHYFEPFAGSGALFFAIASRGAISPGGATLSDANDRLIDTYRSVRDDVDGVIAELHQFRNDPAQYYEVRTWPHEGLPPARRAARIIYLNKTCYNGLYRENRSGQFNVPFGRYRNPRILDEEGLRAASRLLALARLECAPFASVLSLASAGDFVYFDPPYHPLSPTSSFTDYSRDGFGEAQQRALAEVFAELDRRGVHVTLSNSATPLIRSLYRHYHVEEVLAARAINSRGDRRGKITELVIRNYTGLLRDGRGR